jgi:MYXO-CTERM domain-containing protein
VHPVRPGRLTSSLAVATGRKLREASEILAEDQPHVSPLFFLVSLAVAPAIVALFEARRRRRPTTRSIDTPAST